MLSLPDQTRDYGIFTIHEYIDPFTKECTKPTNWDKDEDRQCIRDKCRFRKKVAVKLGSGKFLAKRDG